MPLEKLMENASPQQQLSVLLTLAAGQSSAEAECPAPEILAALMEGRLPQGQRAALLHHLDQCTTCYRAWLGTAALHPVPVQTQGRLLFLRRSPPVFALGGLALAASLFLVLVRWDPFAPDMQGLLSAAYQTALLQGIRPAPGQTAPLPGGEGAKALGFAGADASAPAPIRRAFATGVHTGWDMAQGKEAIPAPPTEKGLAVYHHLGRWTTLLHLFCQTPSASTMTLLQQQKRVGEAMAVVLAEREASGELEARIPRQEMEKINLLLTPAPDEAAHRVCRQILTSCNTLSESLLL